MNSNRGISFRHDPIPSLNDIMRNADVIGNYLEGVSFDDYITNKEKQDAVERRLVNIGEAARNVSRIYSARKLSIQLPPEIEQAVELRNMLAHQYRDVLDSEIWEFIHFNMINLQINVQQMIVQEAARQGKS